MNEFLLHGRRLDNGEWIDGFYHYSNWINPTTREVVDTKYYIRPVGCGDAYAVVPETISRYTGMTEFVMADKSINRPLFEGDIVEVHSVRCPYAAYPQSKYDGPVKARAAIYFDRGMWRLNYDNGYNKRICAPRGNEQYERSVSNSWELYYFGYHGKDEDKYREMNKRHHYHDIVKLGNIHDNPELLEG